MTSARELATTYAAFLSAQLIGAEHETIDFGLWLDDHWDDASGRRRETCLDDVDAQVTPLHAIEWIEEGEEIIGLLAGRYRGCFRIPVTATPPPVALMLDDALACSTGSVHQERAHVTHSTARVDRLLSVAVRPATTREFAPTPAMTEPVDQPAIAHRLGLIELAVAG